MLKLECNVIQKYGGSKVKSNGMDKPDFLIEVCAFFADKTAFIHQSTGKKTF
jgi:hypothetical protein